MTQMLLHLGDQVTGHVAGGQIANGAERQSGHEFVVGVHVVFEGVGGEHEDVGLFGEEEEHAEVAYAFFGEMGGGY